MLTEADLETNVLEFRQRSFQFARLVERTGGPYAVFGRTETESERQLRPKLVRLVLVVPLGWVVHDESADLLRVARGGAISAAPSPAAVVEIAAEPAEFDEQGVRWKRTRAAAGPFVYAPAELAGDLLSPAGLVALGIG